MTLFLRSIYLASALSVFYILLLYRSNPLRRLPTTTITVAFALGMLTVVPLVLVRSVFPSGDAGSAFSAYVNAGLVEEGFKFLVMLLTIWRLRFPDIAEPLDFAIYFGVLGVGFGIYEDFWYIFGGSYGAWTAGDISRFNELYREIVFARAFPGHILFDGLAGCLVGYAYFAEGTRKVAWLAGGFILAVALHGSFNVIAVAGGTIPLLAYVLFLVGGFLLFRQQALSSSPFSAVIRLVNGEGSEWPYRKSPVDYLFTEGFAWPGKARGGMFQIYPVLLSLLILYPLLVATVYVASRVLIRIVGL